MRYRQVSLLPFVLSLGAFLAFIGFLVYVFRHLIVMIIAAALAIKGIAALQRKYGKGSKKPEKKPEDKQPVVIDITPSP